MQSDAKILERIGVSIRTLRRAQNLTQQKLSERSRVHRKFISMVERGQHNVSVLTLCQIIHALGKDFSTFIRELEKELQS